MTKNTNDIWQRRLDRNSNYNIRPALIFVASVLGLNLVGRQILATPQLEKFNPVENVPNPQRQIVVQDKDIKASIKNHTLYVEDFYRIRNELNMVERLTWRQQPVDSASLIYKPIYGKQPTLKEYSRLILRHEQTLKEECRKRAKYKYANIDSKQR